MSEAAADDGYRRRLIELAALQGGLYGEAVRAMRQREPQEADTDTDVED